MDSREVPPAKQERQNQHQADQGKDDAHDPDEVRWDGDKSYDPPTDGQDQADDEQGDEQGEHRHLERLDAVKLLKTSDVCEALRQAADLFEQELEVIEGFHEYAQYFGGTAGSNVFEFVLRDALRLKGWTLEDFLEHRKNKH